MTFFKRGLAVALMSAWAAFGATPGPAEAQVAFSTPGLFNELGAGATPAEGDPPTPPISISPQPPAEPGGSDPADTPEEVVTPPAPPPPPPPPPPEEPELAIYIAVRGTTTGPFDADQLRQKVSSGELTPDTMVWMEGMTEWQPAKEVAQLQDILASAPPPPPEEPTFDAPAYLTGTWEAEPAPLQLSGAERATIRGTVQYRRDKTYEGFGQIDMTASGFSSTMNFTLKGTWSVQNESEQGFVLTLKGTATYFLNTGPFVENVNAVLQMRIVDQNTMVNADGVRSRRIR